MDKDLNMESEIDLGVENERIEDLPLRDEQLCGMQDTLSLLLVSPLRCTLSVSIEVGFIGSITESIVIWGKISNRPFAIRSYVCYRFKRFASMFDCRLTYRPTSLWINSIHNSRWMANDADGFTAQIYCSILRPFRRRNPNLSALNQATSFLEMLSELSRLKLPSSLFSQEHSLR